MKKKIIGIMTGAMLISPLGTVLPGDIGNASTSQVAQAAGGDVISSYTMNPQQVQEIADNMSAISSNGITIIEAAISTQGPVGFAAALASALSRNAADRDVFQNAAARGDGIKVEIKQGPTPNLNTVDYTIV